MRLHHLTMTAIGPYAGTESIDFDALSSSGRFLLTGPTGAGKTTIIDAIVFALYGDVSGAKDSTKDRLRSRFVDSSVDSRVTLQFSCSSGRYEITRTPAYKRLRRDGKGLTDRAATVRLTHLPDSPDDDESLQRAQALTRHDEVGAQIVRIVGLTRDQFTQTIVLPQGKFQTFLRATSEQRHQVLRDVFGTHIYDNIQSRLESLSKDVRHGLERARQDLERAGQNVVDALPEDSDFDHEAFEQAGSDLSQLEGLTTQITAQMRSRHEQACQAAQQAKEVSDAAAQAEQEAKELHSRLERRRCLLVQRDELEADAEQAQIQAEVLQRAQRCAPVYELMKEALSAGKEAQQELSDLADLPWICLEDLECLAPDSDATYLGDLGDRQQNTHSELEDALGCLSQGDIELSRDLSDADQARLVHTELLEQDLETLWTSARDTASHLLHIEQAESTIQERRCTIDDKRAQLQELAGRINSHATQLQELPAKRQALADALQPVVEAQHRLSALQSQHDAALARLEAAQASIDDAAALVALNAQLNQARTQALQATERAHAMRTAWIAATASSLVGELRDNEPCPVCGAREHPAPASSTVELVSSEDLQAADRDVAKASATLQEISMQHASLLQRQELHQEQAEGRSIEQAHQELAAAERAVDEARALAAQRGTIEAQIKSVDDEVTQVQARLASDTQSRTRLDTELAQAARTLEEDCASIARAAGSATSVADRRSHLMDLSARARSYRDALQRVRQLLIRAEQTHHRARQAAQQHGFATMDEVSRAWMPREEQEALSQQLNERQARLRSIHHALLAPEIASLSGDEDPQLEAKSAILSRARLEWEAALATQATIDAQATQVERACRELHDTARSLALAEDKSASMIELARLASGHNEALTPLATWVLSTRFHEVLTFANQRLESMDNGRYILVPSDDEKQAARFRGLGLGVIDRYTDDTPRDPKSLSGGEQFIVALALALALSDAVATESGGIAMETLFIDEGFGSLDSESLDRVMRELSRIQDSGRAVGIISHVDELRRQIPDQIRVKPTPQGSTIQVTTM